MLWRSEHCAQSWLHLDVVSIRFVYHFAGQFIKYDFFRRCTFIYCITARDDMSTCPNDGIEETPVIGRSDGDIYLLFWD